MATSDDLVYRFLRHAFFWALYGAHMDLFETILPRNADRPLMDPSKANATVFLDWPLIGMKATPASSKKQDPLFIETLLLFVNHDPGRLISFSYKISTSYR